MHEKKPKSTILVLAVMLFLAMFIILPPVFRQLFPVEIIEEEAPKKDLLTCVKISAREKLKIISNVTYDEGGVIANNITYIAYAASEDESTMNDETQNVLSAAEELAIFRKYEGIEINDLSASVNVIIKSEVVEDIEDLELNNFLLPTYAQQKKYYELQGYSCN